MEHTPNMRFAKPGYSDPVDIGEINKNFDIIDGKFNADGVGAVDNDLGINPISGIANDTIANWSKLGSGIAFYNGAGQLNDQPSANGILTNICRGNTASYIFQIWSVQGGAVYVRSGENTQGWTNSWRKVYDSVNKPTADDIKALPNNSWQSATDFNTLTTDGVYECQGINVNTPYAAGGDTHFQIIVLAHNVNWIHQIALDVRGYRIFHRFRINGTWSSWNIMLQQGITFGSETDFDTAYNNIDAGFHRMGGGPVTPDKNHAPITSYAGGMIIIPTGAWYSGIVQIYIDYQLSKLYIRSNYYDDANKVWKWYNWAQIYTTNNKPTAADVGALPLSGGTMTGIITRDATFAKTSGADKYMRLFGGTSLEDGAALYLTGQGDLNAGSFLLYATNSTNGKKILHGKPDGTLLWNNKQLYGQHNITSGTGALTAGSSTLINGNIYLQYE